MLHTTKAVVLRTVAHGDRTTVLRAYTEAFGARSCMVRGAAHAARLQPLARLEIVVAECHGSEMQSVRELRVERPYLNVPTDHARGLLLIFAQEVFCRTLRVEAQDPALFRFVQDVLEDIDSAGNLAMQPLLLLIRLAGHLGFRPEPPERPGSLFSLGEGRFFSGVPAPGPCMDEGTSRAFGQLLREVEQAPAISPEQRRELFRQLLIYFRMHVEGFGQLRSPEVLHDMLS